MNAASPLLTAVRRCLTGLGPPSASLVVAVSGGPDSVALLRALLLGRATAPQARLVMAHLNHRLRGSESAADEAFVRQLHADLRAAGNTHLELYCEQLDVAAQTRIMGGNLESTARRLRYDWLARVARQTGSRWVATGHTADDQAETVLHHLLRGTGMRGLRGIAARRPLGQGVELLRPLLTVTRADVLDFLEQLQQPSRQDSSNRDRRLMRNRIRHDLLPLLERAYNPAVKRLLAQLAGQAQELTRVVEHRAQQLLEQAELPRAGPRLILDGQRLQAHPRHVVREVFRLLWAREGWSLRDMDYAAWDRLAGLVCHEVSALALPGPIYARRQGRVVQLGPA